MRIRAWRKALIAHLPWIKRARHRKLLQQMQDRHHLLIDALLAGPSRATQASIVELIPLHQTSCDELCLFVSFAPVPTLKPHVVDHIQSLTAAGIQVVLVINTMLPIHQIQIPDGLRLTLSGCFVRSNTGYDFAAWAQACTLIDRSLIKQRLYFVNDSIVGPLDEQTFQLMLNRFRQLSGDLNGLTESLDQQRHLQSFFLAFSSRLFCSDVFERFTQGALNLPDKQQVIDLYEIQLTRFFREHGYRCKALFPKTSRQPACNDDTIHNWAGLIELGFPYIKASILKQTANAPEVQLLVPAKYRNNPQ